MCVVETMAGEAISTERPPFRLSEARRAFRESAAEGGQPDAAQQFAADYLRRLAAALPGEEIAVILSAEQVREEGLAAGRRGDADRASELLAQAAKSCETAGLSRHASIAAMSFQLAAEAYIKQQRRDYYGAISDLENAILATIELETLYGHNMEFRRVHLARRILRNRSCMAEDAMVVGDTISLLLYIGGHAVHWPIVQGRGFGDPAKMSDSQSAWAIDEVLVNLSLPEIDLARNVHQLPRPEELRHAPAVLRAAIQWCHAVASQHREPNHDLIDHATSFFEVAEGRLVHAGRRLEGVLDEQGIVLD
ncbi:hypothetical protein [Alteraurantiacibacter aquimixticola]|uniref:Uncharacterized protein n=1 Tax=Alteraurantiacibacter aquimixticola TaxID=2489173 RepID=A0A4T3F199_9SPHN|nr:hypothetical protein [Alteraurantiacibacter aquimixticola]TIX49707.1 hypothetical protein E5222_12905 [Alteraurantiacibacter aquimixticola]